MKTEELNESGQGAKPSRNRTHMKPFIGDEEISTDPEYMQLLVEYQNGRWDECSVLLNNLLKKYPGNSRLLEFQGDFEFQYLFHKNAEVGERDKRKGRASAAVKKVGISFGLVLVAILVGVGIFALVYSLTTNRQQNFNQSQVDMLGAQVQALLASGQPEKASEIVQQMKLIEPNNPQVVALGIKVDELMAVNDIYNQAQAKISAGLDADALALLMQIQTKSPNYRDTALLIDQINKRIQVKQLTEAAALAYNESRWEDAINGYEQVLTLDPTSQDVTLKEQLLNSYLRRIIQMLESDQTNIDDITKAELYYRRAVAMIPQSRTFSTERENLQKISSSLLEVKYSQTAIALVEDPNQTTFSINQAVNYMTKAANLNPNNNLLQSEMNKIEMYQVAFKDYIQMQWAPAIEQLTKLMAIDKAYAGGKASQMLYESYVGRGNQYYSVGLYLDARKDFEAAETLAWDTDADNLTKVFMVEVSLGRTLGQLRDYQNAASYFKYAVEAVKFATRAASHSDFVNNLANAGALYDAGSFRESYTLYEKTLADKNFLFSEIDINAQEGTSLAFVAGQYFSSVQAILDYNQLAKATLVTFDQQLKIPYLP